METPRRPTPDTDGTSALAVVAPPDLATVLAPLAKANADFRASSKADATKKAYEADWARYVAWCSRFGQSPLPAAESPAALTTHYATIAAYATRLAVGERDASGKLVLDDDGKPVDPPKKVSTIGRAVASIAHYQRAAGFSWDPKQRDVAETLDGIRRKLGVAPDQKAPVTKEILHSLVATLAAVRTGLGALRDRALLCVGWIGGFRESELVAISREDLTRTREGYVVRVRRSKTDQQGKGQPKVVPYAAGPDRPISPAHALREWLDALDDAGVTDGAVFREITKAGVVTDRLCPPAVAIVVKRTALAAGLDESLYAGHSLRAGLMTECGLQKVPVTEAMAQSGHKRVETAMLYNRQANPFDANGAMRILQTVAEPIGFGRVQEPK